MGKVFVIDVGICNGCYSCQIACKDEHVGNDWSPIAKPQPDTGHFWLKLEEYIRGTVPKVKMHYIPIICQHCDNAPCESVCPVFAPQHSKEGINNQVYNRCIGTRFCSQNCPYKVRRFNWFDWKWPEPLNLQ